MKTLLLSLFLLTSCASYTVPDVEICVDLDDRAFCSTTVSEKTRYVYDNEWREMRTGRLSLTAKDWGELEKAMRKGCKAAGSRCKKEAKKSIATIKRMLKIAK